MDTVKKWSGRRRSSRPQGSSGVTKPQSKSKSPTGQLKPTATIQLKAADTIQNEVQNKSQLRPESASKPAFEGKPESGDKPKSQDKAEVSWTAVEALASCADLRTIYQQSGTELSTGSNSGWIMTLDPANSFPAGDSYEN